MLLLILQRNHFFISNFNDKFRYLQQIKQSVEDRKIKVAVGRKVLSSSSGGQRMIYLKDCSPLISPGYPISNAYATEFQCIFTQDKVNDGTRNTHQNISPCKSQTQVVSWLLSNGLTLEGHSQTNPSMYENVSNMCRFSC